MVLRYGRLIKDINDLKKLIGSTELNLDELEGASGGFGTDDFNPEELATWNSMWAELLRLAKLANTDDSYYDACKKQIDEMNALAETVRKRIEAGG